MNSAGNLFLDQILGARIHWTPKGVREQRMDELALELRSAGKSTYVIPVGGSNPIGALGYVTAMFELSDQLSVASRSVDHIVFATSSGGTQAGLVLGAALTEFPGSVYGIGIDHGPNEDSLRFRAFVAGIASDAAQQLGVPHRFSDEQIAMSCDYTGGGYGVVGDLEREAVRLLARTEGILVGPVYTGRALGGLMNLVRKGAFGTGETVLFWHTGDESALHAYAQEFL
jgi:D-cysteine desulfhydrase